MDFEIDKPPKRESGMKKAFNKKEIRELNERHLWPEPNFSEWYDRNYAQKNKPRGRPRDLESFSFDAMPL